MNRRFYRGIDAKSGESSSSPNLRGWFILTKNFNYNTRNMYKIETDIRVTTVISV